jgi:hypothetical protein
MGTVYDSSYPYLQQGWTSFQTRQPQHPTQDILFREKTFNNNDN